MVYVRKTTYEHYRNKKGPNLFHEKQTFLNIFKLFTLKIRRSFLKLRDSIYIHTEPPKILTFNNKTNEKIETPGPSTQKAKEKEFLNTTRVPIKTIEREKERENEILDSNIENLFIKEPVMLEDVHEENLDKINFLNNNSGGASIKKNKYIINESIPLPAKNNFIENGVNKHNEMVFKSKDMKNEAKHVNKTNSYDFSPRNNNNDSANLNHSNLKPNKSYIIEKENEELSPISHSIEKKHEPIEKSNTFQFNEQKQKNNEISIEEDNKLRKNSNILKNMNEIIFKRPSVEEVRNISKSHDNIGIAKNEHKLDQSFKSFKSDENNH